MKKPLAIQMTKRLLNALNLKRTLALVAVLIMALSLPRTLIADDDDDDDHEHHHGHHYERQTEGLSRTIMFRQLETLPENPKYKAECTSCHMAYHPGLLPARSWTKLMQGLEKHFGENASLDPKTADEIRAFLENHAADKANSRRSKQVMNSISPSDSPLRITETSFFKRRHHEVKTSDFKLPKVGGAHNCVACHSEAEKGYFNEHTVKIPR